jgi:hypothetical protein
MRPPTFGASGVSAALGPLVGGTVGLGLALLTDAPDPAALAAVSALLTASFGSFAPVAWGTRLLPVVALAGAVAGAWLVARLSWDALEGMVGRGPGWRELTALLAGLGAGVIWLRVGSFRTSRGGTAPLCTIIAAAVLAAVFLPLSFMVDLGFLINLSRITISGELPGLDSPEFRAAESAAYIGLFLLLAWVLKLADDGAQTPQ